ncbi:polymer-forming cytoskeletal protein [Hyphomonas sp.]|uniref:bactofilin family protein n=1 Tax=Hyphomonas sp. TaxID=87 RepID=UPI00391BC012
MGAPQTETAAASRIAKDCQLEGDLQFTGAVFLSGEIRGSITCDGTLTVEAGARIDGRVRTGMLIVRGKLKGDIAASRGIEVHTGGEIDGVIYAPSISVARGTRIDGDVMIAPERSEAHMRRAEAMADLEARRQKLPAAAASTATAPASAAGDAPPSGG